MEFSDQDVFFMRRALSLAKKGFGKTNPNPLVGAVIVKDGRIIGSGFHKKYGSLHAEREALASCAESPNGADIYVTLEPCCHYGKQPPCTEALVTAGIKRVFVAVEDPNPLVCGKGSEFLRSNGIEVFTGLLQNEARALNEIFFHYIESKSPFIAVKFAESIDGKIACANGNSKWISSERSRLYAHKLRAKYSSIMVGIGTVLADDPLLSCRIKGGRNPVRIVCDSDLKIPVDCKIVKTASKIKTVIAYCENSPENTRQSEGVQSFSAKIDALKNAGCLLLKCPEKNGHVDLKFLFGEAGRLNIDSVLIEGGGTLLWSVINENLADKAHIFISPKIIGGANAKTPVEGEGFSSPENVPRVKEMKIKRLGEDFLIEGRIER